MTAPAFPSHRKERFSNTAWALSDERGPTTVGFLSRAVAWLNDQGTNAGGCEVTTGPDTPPTAGSQPDTHSWSTGKAERFIQPF
jgi:hypothetical protein